jgi:hypothetical protein
MSSEHFTDLRRIYTCIRNVETPMCLLHLDLEVDLWYSRSHGSRRAALKRQRLRSWPILLDRNGYLEQRHLKAYSIGIDTPRGWAVRARLSDKV